MKKLATLILGLMTGVGLYAQGTVNFANAGAGGLNAPVHIDTLSGPLAAAGYMAQLVLVNGATLTPVGSTAAFIGTAAPGYFNGGVRDSGLAGGATGTFRVFAWDSAAGGTAYAAALASWTAGSIYGGWSIDVTVPTGGAGTPPGPFTPPAALTGLQPWAVTIVPEPSTIALGVIGGLALLLRRRK